MKKLKNTTIGEDFPIQQKRIRDIHQNASRFDDLPYAQVVSTCARLLKESEEAWISNDAVRLTQAYASLRNFKV